MTLSEEDGKLFYKLWIPLLGFVKRKYCDNLHPEITKIDKKTLVSTDFKAIANKLWDNVSIIDEYLSESTELSEEEREIVRSWKRCVKGKFALERHLKKGSIFISMDNEEVYLVSGIVSSWEEMFSFYPMPLIIEATFIPFRNVIISDGLVVPYNIFIGGGMKSMFKDAYMAAKDSGRIHSTL